MRALIPLIAALIAVGVVIGVLNSGAEREPVPDTLVEANAPAATGALTDSGLDTPADSTAVEAQTARPVTADPARDASAAVEPVQESSGPLQRATPQAAQAAAVADNQVGVQTEAAGGYRAKGVPADAAAAPVLGSDDPDSGFKLRVETTSFGAGLRRVDLTEYARSIGAAPRYTVLDAGASPAFYPLAARAVYLNDQRIPLAGQRWALTDSGPAHAAFSLDIVDGAGTPVATLKRSYRLSIDSYSVGLEQSVQNRTDAPLKVRYAQFDTGDLVLPQDEYLGDRRMRAAGYFRPEAPPKTQIYVDGTFRYRTELAAEPAETWWRPGFADAPEGAVLAWLATEDRYFASVIHRPLPPKADDHLVTADVPSLEAVFPAATFQSTAPNGPVDRAVLVGTLSTADRVVPAGGVLPLDLSVFIGPRQRELLSQQPYAALDLHKLIRYEITCTFCTFQWLAKGLLAYLTLLESVVGDWGVAIILLVLTVRLLLHPITKRAQGSMMRMGKQMQSIQPEMQKIKEKYKDQPQKANAEVMKLYREKGVNPAGFLGCLPMFLQTPIWIALYAMLFYAIELRHEPAFYGVFQAVSGGAWEFLADLSVPDHFLMLPGEGLPMWLPIIGSFRIDAINILPVLWAVVLLINMKYTTPPPATPEQASQQRIFKIMTGVFPIFLYPAPSGLMLYMTASTLAGIVDSAIVRRQIKREEESGDLFKKKDVKPGSLRDRMGKRFEAAAQQARLKMEEKQKQADRK